MFWLYFDLFCHDNIIFCPFWPDYSKKKKKREREIPRPVLRSIIHICNTFVTMRTQEDVLPRVLTRGWLESAPSVSSPKPSWDFPPRWADSLYQTFEEPLLSVPSKNVNTLIIIWGKSTMQWIISQCYLLKIAKIMLTWME